MQNETQYTATARDTSISIILVILLLFVLGWNVSPHILTFFLGLSDFTVMTVSPFEMVQNRFSITCAFVFAVSLPFVYTESYRYISPALFEHELRVVKWSTVPFFFMFICGVTFAIEVFLPVVMLYANRFYTVDVLNSVTLSNYVSFLISSMLLFGVVFCIPVVLGILSWIGLIDHKIMSRYRGIVWVGMLVVGAIITPPDVFTQLLVSVPLVLLYEMSIIMSWIINRPSKTASAVTG